MTPARFRWGMLLVLVGTLLLLVNADVLNHNFWIDFIWAFPFVLIAIGIEKIFSHTRFKIISYVTTVALVAGALYIAFEGSATAESGSFFDTSTLVYDEEQQEVDLIQADVDVGGSSLTIRDATDELLYGRFGAWSRKPSSSMEIDGRTANIKLDSRENNRLWQGTIRVENDEPDDWRLSFSREVPLDLTVTGEDNELSLNLATTPLRLLTVDADDADIYVKVGTLEPEVQVKVKGSDSKLRLRLPQESGLLVTGVDDPSYLEQLGLEVCSQGYITRGYDTATVRCRVDLSDTYRSLSIDYY